jgi:hypothetical protein
MAPDIRTMALMEHKARNKRLEEVREKEQRMLGFLNQYLVTTLMIPAMRDKRVFSVGSRTIADSIPTSVPYVRLIKRTYSKQQIQ